jgi:hypothetical protein
MLVNGSNQAITTSDFTTSGSYIAYATYSIVGDAPAGAGLGNSYFAPLVIAGMSN